MNFFCTFNPVKPKKIHYLLTALLPFQILWVQWLAKHTEWIESYYSNGVYPYISAFLRLLLGWLPFSFGDVLLLIFVLMGLRFVYKSLKHLRTSWKFRLLQLTSFVSVMYGCFYLFWGYNYFRLPLAENLGLSQGQYTSEELLDISDILITKANQAQWAVTNDSTAVVVLPQTQKDLYNLAVEAYKDLAHTYPQLAYKFPSVKSSAMSLLQSYNGTSGYLNPLTGEAQVNDRIPLTGYPTTTCHEIAHQIGFAAENEANFVGFLAASHSKNQYFQYSAYRMALRYVIFELYKRDPDKYKTQVKKINPGILKDYNQSAEFWRQFKNPLEPVIKKGYNAYLKVNKQAKGIDSYNYVVDLLISYYTEAQ